MSERGSMVTEYIYCDACFKAMRRVMPRNNKYANCSVVPSWREGQDKNDVYEELPIIAAKIGGVGPGADHITFQHDIRPLFEKVICHPVRIAVLCDDPAGDMITTIYPREGK